jgi:tetratricopeptide (TPR) repeat protein
MLHLWRSDRTLAAVLFAWFAVTLLPVFYLGSFGDVLYADRFLYIPAVGFFLGAAQTVRGAWPKSEGMRARWRALIGVLHAVVSICLITYASQSARYWKDGPTLFRRASATSPDSAYIHFNLGSCLIRRGAHEDAMKAYRRAADLAPRFPQVYVNLGAALARVGRHDEALAYFRQAMLLGDNGYLVHAHLGNCYGELGFAEQAEEAYARSLSLRETAWVHARLGALLLDATRPEAAEAHLRRSLALEPSAETYLYLGVLFARNGEPEQALACLKCCLRFPVGRRSMRVTAATHLELARLYMRLLREYEASVHMAEAWRCTSSDPATYDMVSRFAEQLNDAETDIRSHGLGLP